MTRRSWITTSLLFLAAGMVLLFVLLREEGLRRERAARAATGLLGGPGPSRDGEVQAAPVARIEFNDPAARARDARRAGALEAEPETLVALAGRVVDEQSGLGVAGMKLSFLSRRPRTALVTTGLDGAFRTECVLSCGVVTVMHVPDPDDLRFATRWSIEPAQLLLPADGDGPVRYANLTVQSPERVLEVSVQHADGTAASASNVGLVWGERRRDGGFEVLGRDFELADREGRARFALPGEPPESRLFEAEAESGLTEISDALCLRPPFGAKPLGLELYSGGTLRVRCLTERGEPLSGVSLWLENADAARAPRGRAGDTDLHGECVFTPLASGCWSVRAVHPLTGQSLLAESDLPRGAERVLALRLPLANLLPGVRGIVLDEEDHPLEGVALRVRNGNEGPVTIFSRAGGTFEFWGQASAGIELVPGPGLLDDEYLPALLDLPFGTAGVVLRRAGREEPLSFAVELVARGSGARVRAARLVLRCAAPQAGEQSYSAPAGVTQVSLPRTRSVRFEAEAPGYRLQRGEVADLLEARHAGVLRIELEPGFARGFDVSDRVTHHVLAGARFWLGKELVATSDETGHVEIELAEWPAALRVECSGYELFEWNPLAAGSARGELRLEALTPR